MLDIWTIYKELLLAAKILASPAGHAPREILNETINAAWDILYTNLPKLEEAIEQLEEK